MRKIFNRKQQKVTKITHIVTNRYGTTGLVYTDTQLALDFLDRMNLQKPESAPWLKHTVKIKAYPSEYDYDLVYDYLLRKKKVHSRTPKMDLTTIAMKYFSQGNYSLVFSDAKDKWVVKNKQTGRTYEGTMPLEAIQKMLRVGGGGKVKARLSSSH